MELPLRILGNTRAALAAATVLASGIAHAEPISVIGNDRVPTAVIEQVFGSSDRKRFSDAELDAGIKQLFTSGFFSDVKARRGNGILVVQVVERPVVGHVVFNGNDRLKDEALASVAGLTSGMPLEARSVDRAAAAMSEAYSKVGRQQAKISKRTLIRDGNVADIEFTIVEGEKTKVTSITIEGAQAFSQSRLKGVLLTKESTPLSLVRNDDIYDLEKTEKDVEALRSFYHDAGYIDATVSGPEVVFDDKSNEIYLVYSVSEGRQYRVGEVSVVGSSDAPDAITGIKQGDIYSPSNASAAATKAMGKMARLGEAEKEVTVRPDRKPDGTVDVGFVVDEVAVSYVERIEITGNYKTAEYVIRREIDFAEGDRLSRAMLDRVEKRLKALGLFSAVRISASKGSAEDRTIVAVSVVEQPSGSFEIGGGYSSKDGPLAVLSFNERNFMGAGRGLRASVGRGTDSGTYELGLTEPYLFGYRVTGELDVFRREWDTRNNGYHPYDEIVSGAQFGLTFPITDESLVSAYYAISTQEITDVDDLYAGIGTPSDPSLVTMGDYVRSVLGGEWTLDTFDDPRNPSEGFRIKIGQEFAGLGGDARYSKTEFTATSAHELDPVRDIVAHLSIKGGAIDGLGQDLTFIEQFRPGNDLVRGFASGGFGPRDAGTGFSLGGQYYAGASAEARLPMPLMPEGFGLKSAFFADAGTVWGADEGRVRSSGATVSSDDFSVRASVGTGIIWDSPFGMLRADFAVPIAKETGDRTQVFSLSGGTRF